MPIYIGDTELSEITDEILIAHNITIQEVYSGDVLIWMKRGFVVTASPASFTFTALGQTGHTLTLTYSSTELVTQDSITLPDWLQFVSIQTTGTQETTTSVITFNTLTNVDLNERIDEIITTFNMAGTLSVALTQPGAPQLTGGQFVTDGESATVFNVDAMDVTIGAGGGPLDLVTFGAAGAQFYLGPILGTGYGGVRVFGVTLATFISLGDDVSGSGDVSERGTAGGGFLNLQVNNIDRDDVRPTIGPANTGRNLFGRLAGSSDYIFIGTIRSDGDSNGSTDRIRLDRGGNTQTDINQANAILSAGMQLWISDDATVVTATATGPVRDFDGDVPITLDSGARVDDGTIHSIGSNGRLTIGMQGIAGPDLPGLGIQLNPVNSVSDQPNEMVTNTVERSAELVGAMDYPATSFPVPGNNFNLPMSLSGHVEGDAILFEIFTAATRLPEELIDFQSQTGNQWDARVAVLAGTAGVATTTTFYGRITQGVNIYPEAGTDQTLQANVTSAALRFSHSFPDLLFWNERIHTITSTTSTGSAVAGVDEFGWSINDFSYVHSGEFGTSAISTTSSVGNDGFSAIITNAEVNHNPDTGNVFAVVLNLRYTYPNAVFGSTETFIDLESNLQSQVPPRPRVPMTLIPSGTNSIFDTDFNAMATIRVISDSGSQIATSAASLEAQYPTIDGASTPLWIEDNEQIPTNAALTADTANLLDETFNIATDQVAIEALEAATPGFFDSNGTRSLLPYARAYTFTVSTHDADDTTDDSDDPIAGNIGRNVGSQPRVASVVVVCNDR